MTNTDQITSDQHECYQNITTFLRDQGFGEQLKALLPLFPEELTNPHPEMTDEYGKAYAVVLPGGLSGVAVKASEGGYMFYGKDGYSSRGLLGKHDFSEVTALEIPRENEIGVTPASATVLTNQIFALLRKGSLKHADGYGAEVLVVKSLIEEFFSKAG